MQARTDVKFKVGDKAVYPAQGVAEVISIEEKDIAGARQRFYVLRILDTDRKIMVPVTNASAVGLRPVISEVEIREIFDILGERRMLDTARSLIVKEIAIAREQTEENVKTEIEAIFLTN